MKLALKNLWELGEKQSNLLLKNELNTVTLISRLNLLVAGDDLLHDFRAQNYVTDLMKSLENYIALNHVDLSVEPYFH